MSQATPGIPGEDEICSQCGHLFNPHRLLGYGDPPTEGWMECPVPGCTCRMTWSMAPSAPSESKTTIKGEGPPMPNNSLERTREE